MGTFTVSVSELIAQGFDFGMEPSDYPIFDESYRDPLNTKIIRHYWNYEIGHETESMWRFSLNRKLNEIMPYYNQLYLSTKIQFDPLSTMDYSEILDGTGSSTGNTTDTDTSTTTSNGTSTSHTDNTTETDSSSRGVHSDFPQVPLSGDQDYASSMEDSTSKTTGTGSQDSTGSTTGTDSTTRNGSGTVSGDSTNHTERDMTGYNGPASELLMNYRRTLLNVDMMVITDLRVLFMGLWDNGDSFTGQSGFGWGMGYGYF